MSIFPQLQLMLAADIQKLNLRKEHESLEMQEVKRQQFVQMRRKRFDFNRVPPIRQAHRRQKQPLHRKTPAIARK